MTDTKPKPSPAPRSPTTRSRLRLVRLYQSAVGKKWVMAVTGIILLGFVATHMIGNLKLYIGWIPEEGAYEIDIYAESLRDLLFPLLPRTYLLWGMRLVLLAAVFFHIHAAATLTIMNRRARPESYAGPRQYQAANYASRTMRWSGIIVGAFVLFHLADLTWGSDPVAATEFTRGEVYHNVVASFSRWPVSLFYIVANLLLGLHIYHGAWSMFQSLGWNHPVINRARRGFAGLLALAIVVGNVSFPIAVLVGLIE